MALKTIMCKHRLDLKTAELQELEAKDESFLAKEAELSASTHEAKTQEELDIVEAAVCAYDTEREAHENAKAALRGEISALEAELAELENNDPPAPTVEAAAEHHEERMISAMTHSVDIRALPMAKRAFDALPMAQRQALVEKPENQSFLASFRQAGRVKASISGGELTIPIDFLDLIAENMYRYSKLLNRVRVRNVNGQARQTVAGVVPEAVWTEMCGIINELTFQFNQVSLDGYKLAGFIPVCNSLLEDSDIALASWIVEMLSEALGLGMDKAILYGKGPTYHMPLGIVTRLAQQSKPAGYPDAAPAWTDLHTSNIKSINNSYTGAEFWAALQLAAGNTFTKYARGTQFWAMNSKTYAKLKSKAITFTASGDVVANVFGILPIVTGDIDILEFMPDDDIVGGYGDLYLVAQRAGMTIEASREVQFIQDNTVFKGKMRADGMPVIAGAFVAINIAGNSPTTELLFAGDDANTVTGLMMNTATAAIEGTGTVQLEAIPLPFGVKVDPSDITWASGTSAKATVSSSGLVTGVTAGNSVITATCNGKTAQCTVTVT